MSEKIVKINDQKSGNAVLIDTCNNFREMNVPTIQPITLDENGKIAYRSKGGLIGIYTEKALDEIIEAMEDLRSSVKKYEQEAKVSNKKEETVDEEAMDKALQTLISIGHSEAQARKILKLDEKQQEDKDDLPEDIRITLQILLDKGMDKSKAYRTLGLTKNGKIDRRKKR